MKKIKIGPGEHYVTQQKGVTIVTVLGSCVAACIRDPLAGVGGMNHFMLPESDTGVWGGISANMRYGNHAMEELINDIMRQGGQRNGSKLKCSAAPVFSSMAAPSATRTRHLWKPLLRLKGCRSQRSISARFQGPPH